MVNFSTVFDVVKKVLQFYLLFSHFAFISSSFHFNFFSKLTISIRSVIKSLWTLPLFVQKSVVPISNVLSSISFFFTNYCLGFGSFVYFLRCLLLTSNTMLLKNCHQFYAKDTLYFCILLFQTFFYIFLFLLVSNFKLLSTLVCYQ